MPGDVARRADGSAAGPIGDRGARRSEGAWAIFDRLWPLAMVALAPLVVWLNFDARGMQALYPSYVCLRETILAGLDADANTCGTPTFPMWGYAWLLVPEDGKALLLLAQNLLGIGAVWFFVRSCERTGVLAGAGARAVKVALVLSLPLYAFHSLRWPYSPAVSLLLVALGLLLLALARRPAPLRLLAASGLLIGLALNFRSDYVAFPLLLAGLAVVLSPGRRRELAGGLLVWLAGAAVLLVPWMAYTHSATGSVLLTSSNGGHVLFIGLGNLPGNPWGITPYDGDPRMHRELREHFGREVSSLTHEADVFLRRRFLELVADEPAAYARKVAYSAGQTVVGGVYEGEFLEEDACTPGCREAYPEDATSPAAVRPLFEDGYAATERLRWTVHVASALEGRLVALVGFPLAVLLFGASLARRRLALAVVTGVAVYQLGLNAVASYLPSYSSNAYVPLVVSLGAAATLVAGRRSPEA